MNQYFYIYNFIICIFIFSIIEYILFLSFMTYFTSKKYLTRYFMKSLILIFSPLEITRLYSYWKKDYSIDNNLDKHKSIFSYKKSLQLRAKQEVILCKDKEYKDRFNKLKNKVGY